MSEQEIPLKISRNNGPFLQEISETGEIYFGQYNTNSERAGRGLYLFSDGSWYFGDWKNNNFAGGLHFYSAGYFRWGGYNEEGIEDGYGKVCDGDGSYYQGNWMGGVQVGRGISGETMDALCEGKGKNIRVKYRNASRCGSPVLVTEEENGEKADEVEASSVLQTEALVATQNQLELSQQEVSVLNTQIISLTNEKDQAVLENIKLLEENAILKEKLKAISDITYE